MNCTKCKKEIPKDSKFCLNCGEKINNSTTESVINTKSNSVTRLKKGKTLKREGIAIGGIVVPTFFISIFCIILGFGGYISPLLLLSAVLLLAKANSKALTHNIVVILAIYGTQFVIETALTFLASIPAKLLAWLSNIAASNIDFVTTMGNISTGLENVFAVITNFIGICFFAIYIICIFSLCKSDKIKIPFLSDFIKSVFLSNIAAILPNDDKTPVPANQTSVVEDIVTNTETETETETITENDTTVENPYDFKDDVTKTLSGIFNSALKTDKREKKAEPNFKDIENFETAIVSQISELNDMVADEQASKEELENAINEIVPNVPEEVDVDKTVVSTKPENTVKEIVEEILEETKTDNFVDEFEKHFEHDNEKISDVKETENIDDVDIAETSSTVEENTHDIETTEENENKPSAPPIKNQEEKTKPKNRRKRRRPNKKKDDVVKIIYKEEKKKKIKPIDKKKNQRRKV